MGEVCMCGARLLPLQPQGKPLPSSSLGRLGLQSTEVGAALLGTGFCLAQGLSLELKPPPEPLRASVWTSKGKAFRQAQDRRPLSAGEPRVCSNSHCKVGYVDPEQSSVLLWVLPEQVPSTPAIVVYTQLFIWGLLELALDRHHPRVPGHF